jgi:hypothetical protein
LLAQFIFSTTTIIKIKTNLSRNYFIYHFNKQYEKIAGKPDATIF